MKFTQTLSTHLTPEWRLQYIEYANLKQMIKYAVENAPLVGSVTPNEIKRYYTNFQDSFFFECENELRKVNTFFAEKLAEANRRIDALMASLEVEVGEIRYRPIASSAYRIHVKRRQMLGAHHKLGKKALKLAYSELYLSLVLLQNYQVLNYTGFRKILKKYDKFLASQKGAQWLETMVNPSAFNINHDLNRLIDEVEYHFTHYLENGNRSEAMKRLRVPRLAEHQKLSTVFRLGLFIGILLVLVAFIFIILYNKGVVILPNPTYDFLLFRCQFFIIFYMVMIGINVYGWRLVGVNHILIFEIDPRDHLTHSDIFELAAVFGVLWALCFLAFCYAIELNLPAYIFPLLLMFLMVGFVVLPLPIFHMSSRFWLIKLIGRVITAPFWMVNFADFWMGDQLNSLAICLVDLKKFFCIYITNPAWRSNFKYSECIDHDDIGTAIVRCLPPWFRFAQCMKRYHDTKSVHPFLTNAMKYFSSFPPIIFNALMSITKDDYENFFQNPYVWCFIISQTISSIYCNTWDILRDFSLFETFKEGNMFLRDNIIYSKAFYYFVILENVILRFFWAISMYLVLHNYINYYNMDTISGMLEITRRYIWNYVRLENEHLFNVGRFRAVRDIFVTPITDMDGPHEVEQMMDAMDGDTNKYRSGRAFGVFINYIKNLPKKFS